MNQHVINLQEALAQGSTAGQMASVAGYHCRLAAQFKAEIWNLSRQMKGQKPTTAQQTRMRDLKAMKESSDNFFNHFQAMASAMRRIENA